MENKADIGLGLFTPTAEHFEVADFSMPVRSLQFLAIFAKPDIHRDYFCLFKPFELRLWFTIAFWISALALAFLFISVVHLLKDGLQQNGNDPRRKRWELYRQDCVLLDCLFWPINIVCNKVVYTVPHKLPYTALVFSTSVAAMFLNTVYSGNLLSFVYAGLEPFHALDQLLNSGYSFAAVRHSTMSKPYFIVSKYFECR